ncbi:hypothetical protein [Streptomyces tubercidicus]
MTRTTHASLQYAIHHLSAVDEVLMMRRDAHPHAHPLYQNTLGGQGRWARRPAAALPLAAEQDRPYTGEEAAWFWVVQRWLHTTVPQYRDDLVAIAGPACPLMPAQQPRQLHRPAPAATLPVPAYEPGQRSDGSTRRFCKGRSVQALTSS